MYTLFQLIPHFHHNNLQRGVTCYHVNCKMWHLFPTRGRSGIACTHACGNTFPVHTHSSLPSLIKPTPSWAGCFERYRGSWYCASYITFLQQLFWKYSSCWRKSCCQQYAVQNPQKGMCHMQFRISTISFFPK